MKEATHKPAETVVAEQPKTKVGTKTEVEGAEAKVSKPRAPKASKFRLIAGVESGAFRGQRALVVKALQELGEGAHTPEVVAAKCEAAGLVSKTPVLASTLFHLKGLAADGKVEAIVDPVAETKAEEKKAA